MVTIRLQKGGGGSVSHMTKPREIIGAGPGADWTVKDPQVSPKHTALWIGADGGLWVEDLGSASGTRVNGALLVEPKRLAETDTVEIGPAVLTVSGLLPDGRVPAGALFRLPRAGDEENNLEQKRNEAIAQLDPDAAQRLAYAWCERVLRAHVAAALEAADFLDEASALRRAAPVTNRETSMAAHERLRLLERDVQRALQERTDAGHAHEELETANLALQVARVARDAVRASVAPYGGRPGFAVMIGFGEQSVPPEDDRAARAAYALPRAGVVAGHVVDAARILDAEGGLAEVRQQVKEVIEAAQPR